MRSALALVLAACLSAPVVAQPVLPARNVIFAPAAADSGQETVCRKIKETGSLVKSKKTCHTAAQWAYIEDQHRQFGRQMVQDGTTRPGGSN